MIPVDSNETRVGSVDKKAEGGDAKTFTGVAAVQTRAGAVEAFEGFFGDGLGRGSMLWGP